MTWGMIGAAGVSLVGGKLLGGGGANALAGMATAQRIPGQTQAGEYTPQAGGFGTYNYIPTGATQIDPALISAILGSLGVNQGVAGQAGTTNADNFAFASGNQPYSDYLGAMGDYANFARGSNAALGQIGATLGGAGNANLSNLAGLFAQSQNNPFAQSMISGAQGIGQNLLGAGSGLQNLTQSYLGGVQNQVGSLLANPYLQLAQMGGNQAGSMLQGTGASTYGQGQQLSNAASGGIPAAQSVLNTAFDPQQQLYDRTLQQTQDQIGALLARTGLTNSGAGGKIAADALSNFNIDWQNNQLGRQTTGLSSYNNALTGAGNNLSTGANLQTGAAGTYAQGAALPAQTYQQLGDLQLGNLNALGSAASTGANVLPTAGNLQLQGNSAGYGAFNTDLANQLGYAQAYGNGTQQYGNTANQLGQLTGQMGTNLYNAAQSPFNAFTNVTGAQNTALSNFLTNATSGSNLTNQNITQLMNYLNSVMTGANNASNAASGAQGRTVTQNANAAAGMTPLIQGGIDALGGAFKNWIGGSGSSGGYFGTTGTSNRDW